MNIPLILKQMMRYAGVGGVSAIVHYATLIAAVELAQADPVFASVVASAAGALVNYALNYHYTFSSDRAHHISVLRFAIVATTGAALNAALMALGVDILGAHYLPTQVVATIIVFFWHFIVNRIWTFGTSER